MNSILSIQDQRYLQILEKLYNEPSSYDILEDLTNASINTIRKDIKRINGFIEPLYITFNYQESKFFLKKPDNLSIDYIYSKIISNSLEFNLLEMIFFEEEVRLEDYAERLYVSISTLKRLINRINRAFNNKVFINTNPIQLIGDERILCHFMIYFFKEKYIDFNYPFKVMNTEVFKIFIEKVLAENIEFSNFPDMERLKLVVLVSLTRIQNGHYLNLDSVQTLNDYHIQLEDDNLFKHSFKSIFQVELNNKNLMELMYPFIDNNFAHSYKDLINTCKENKQKNKELSNIISLLDDISTTLNIDLAITKKKKLILDLFNVRVLSVSNDYVLYNSKLDFLNNLKKDDYIIYDFLNTKILQSPFLIHLSEYERIHFSYMIITHWEGLFTKIQESRPIFDVGIFMTSDIEHTLLISQILNKKFKNKFNFNPIQFMDFNNLTEEFTKYQFIVTNISRIDLVDDKFININLYPSIENLSTLDSKYNEILSNSNNFY